MKVIRGIKYNITEFFVALSNQLWVAMSQDFVKEI